MKFTLVILGALFCLNAGAQEISEDKSSDDALLAAAEKLIAEGNHAANKVVSATADVSAVETKAAESTKAEVAPPLKTEDLKESEIPVLMSTAKAAKSESNLLWRMVASLAFLAVIAGVLLYSSKRWGRKKDKGGQKARIEMLHQFHLGPRKSLALVRVSGETVLVGVTDQNINMLKTVTLIDDELEGVMNKDFNGFLEDEFSIEDVRSALSEQ